MSLQYHSAAHPLLRRDKTHTLASEMASLSQVPMVCEIGHKCSRKAWQFPAPSGRQILAVGASPRYMYPPINTPPKNPFFPVPIRAFYMGISRRFAPVFRLFSLKLPDKMRGSFLWSRPHILCGVIEIEPLRGFIVLIVT